jgi:Gluconate 2-dehydrogenase subunit 3
MTNRREFVLTSLGLWQAAALQAQHHHEAALQTAADYRFTFLNPAMRQTLRVAMDLMIPADERSGGALAAKTDEYVDFILAHADPKLQETWREGLARLAKAKNADEFLSVQARKEFSPETDDEAFFVLLKQAVTAGFYTSAEGIENELGYQGMTFALEFAGCTHSEHQAPGDWKPWLRQRSDG